jgi:hypothetical protein
MLRKTTFLLVVGYAISATEVYINSWTADECAGAPNSIFRFKMSDTSGRYTSKTETWPNIFRYIIRLQYTFGQCSAN